MEIIGDQSLLNVSEVSHRQMQANEYRSRILREVEAILEDEQSSSRQSVNGFEYSYLPGSVHVFADPKPFDFLMKETTQSSSSSLLNLVDRDDKERANEMRNMRRADGGESWEFDNHMRKRSQLYLESLGPFSFGSKRLHSTAGTSNNSNNSGDSKGIISTESVHMDDCGDSIVDRETHTNNYCDDGDDEIYLDLAELAKGNDPTICTYDNWQELDLMKENTVLSQLLSEPEVVLATIRKKEEKEGNDAEIGVQQSIHHVNVSVIDGNEESGEKKKKKNNEENGEQIEICGMERAALDLTSSDTTIAHPVENETTSMISTRKDVLENTGSFQSSPSNQHVSFSSHIEDQIQIQSERQSEVQMEGRLSDMTPISITLPSITQTTHCLPQDSSNNIHTIRDDNDDNDDNDDTKKVGDIKRDDHEKNGEHQYGREDEVNLDNHPNPDEQNHEQHSNNNNNKNIASPSSHLMLEYPPTNSSSQLLDSLPFPSIVSFTSPHDPPSQESSSPPPSPLKLLPTQATQPLPQPSSSLEQQFQKQERFEHLVDTSPAQLRKQREFLQRQYRHFSSQNAFVSEDIVLDIVEILQIFGIPYVFAPGEAEAQCAFLEMMGFVDGVISNDSDVFAFGGKTIYKDFFIDNQYIEAYKIEDIEKELGFTRERIIEYALLEGCDYCEVALLLVHFVHS